MSTHSLSNQSRADLAKERSLLSTGLNALKLALGPQLAFLLVVSSPSQISVHLFSVPILSKTSPLLSSHGLKITVAGFDSLNLLRYTHILHDDGSLCVIHMDFKKAFGNVAHKLIVYKLFTTGIKGKPPTRNEDFLRRRPQTLYIEASNSTYAPILICVSKGSVLGPSLFLVYTNDSAENLSCSAVMFVDDVTL
ncbi:unnamed protein product [Dibothriocephalus latus]|uniref:Reverse transcriptase domain-containing protein n=1 Tax=Dibothriocephalus latus TaxID=60516 RepID=A0A3P7MDY3_DIBLA|nr:unnamed protein product [Dibothriocephalus latus]